MSRRLVVVVVAVCAVAVAGCDLLDPERPSPYPDSTVYGNLLEVVEPTAPDDPWVVRLRVGAPRELTRAEEAGGMPPPEVEDGLVAEVVVGPDSVVVFEDRFASLDDLPPGTEVVVLPVLGSTRMMGSSLVLVEARYLLDFGTYRRWQLPKLESDRPAPAPRTDPERINSDGVESAPVPVGDGTVLYFTARLRPTAEGSWTGAARSGLEPVEGRPLATERTFRTELEADGWSSPEPMVFEGTDDAGRVMVSWVSPDEKRCLVTIQELDSPPWVGVSTRRSASGVWRAPEPVADLGEQDASDGVYLAGSDTKLVFVSARDGGVQSDLYLHDPDMETTPLPLEPQLNTVGDEWGPRIGPDGELFFVRDERQMLRSGGTLHQVRLPGPHRAVLTHAAPTADGRWVFFCQPRFRPVELDLDIWVAPHLGDGRLGPAVAVDEWRPDAG